MCPIAWAKAGLPVTNPRRRYRPEIAAARKSFAVVTPDGVAVDIAVSLDAGTKVAIEAVAQEQLSSANTVRGAAVGVPAPHALPAAPSFPRPWQPAPLIDSPGSPDSPVRPLRFWLLVFTYSCGNHAPACTHPTACTHPHARARPHTHARTRTHTLHACTQALGAATARAKLLESKGYKAVLVSAAEWGALADTKAKTKFLLTAVKAAAPSAAGKVGRGCPVLPWGVRCWGGVWCLRVGLGLGCDLLRFPRSGRGQAPC